MKNTMRASSGVTNKLSLVYPYTPLEENFQDLDEQQAEHSGVEEEERLVVDGVPSDGGGGRGEGTSSSSSRPLLLIGCAKTGLWGLKYREEKTQKEFMRFCHRALDGALPILIYWLGGMTWLIDEKPHAWLTAWTTAQLTLALVVEIGLHTVVRAGTGYSYEHARMRHASHVLAALSLLLEVWVNRIRETNCLPDSNYSDITGHEASPTTRYHSCVRAMEAESLNVVLMLFCTLRLDIHFHFFVTISYWIGYTVVLFTVVPQFPHRAGVLSLNKVQDDVIRVAVLGIGAVVSNLIAVAKNRSLQRGLEAALKVHYQMRASKRKMETLDTLLASMVPPSALTRLLKGDRVHDYTPMATVLFSDMVHFTQWSSVRTPQQVVAMLSVLNRAFDTLAADMEVSKVKTIGDCYWAVAGIPTAMEDHAEVMINFGLAMLDLVRKEATVHKEWDYPSTTTTEGVPSILRWDTVDTEGDQRRPIDFRTGIHSGPVSGGVLGTQQISYEVFGETSTFANHVEASGLPDRVTVSANTKRIVTQWSGTVLPFHFARRDGKPMEEDQPLTSMVTRDSGDEDTLFVVTSNKADGNSQSQSRSSRQGSSSLQGVVNLVASKDREEERAREQRRKFVETHLSKKGEDVHSHDDDQQLELSDATKEEVIEEYSTRKYCCVLYTFANPEVEAAYQRFVVTQLIDIRYAGGFASLCVYGILFAMLLSDHSGPIPPASILLMVASLVCSAAGVVLAAQRRHAIKRVAADSSEVSDPSTVADYVGPGLCFLSAPLWQLGCIVAHDSILTTNNMYVAAFAVFLVGIPNSHLPAVTLSLVILPVLALALAGAVVKMHDIFTPFALVVLGFLWFIMMYCLYEKRLRVQFIEGMVAAHFAAQQAVARQAQEAVLTAMLPDFVIAPLTTWLASNFDPLKSVVQNHKEVCVAFIRMTPPSVNLILSPTAAKTGAGSPHSLEAVSFTGSDSIPGDRSEGGEPEEMEEATQSLCQEKKEEEKEEQEEVHSGEADGTCDWLFEGHNAVDEILAATKTVDKVKTVGDLIIVAGSFRGHPSAEAAAALLSVAVQVHSRFGISLEGGAALSSVTIGLHVGPVMGIVLGFSRLAFDIFGDTVNTCSRVMTSPNAKHKITATSEYLNLLPAAPFPLQHPTPGAQEQTTIEFGPVCEVKAKGKGVLGVSEIRHLSP